NNNQQTGAGANAQDASQSQVRTTKGKYSLQDFEILRTLGTGSFGRVHLVQSRHNTRFYAIKVLKKAQVVRMKQVEHTNDERRMLAEVKHPFLVTLWGTFQDSKNLYMVMDFVEGGELFSLLRKSGVSIVLEMPLVIEWRHGSPSITALPKPCSQVLRSGGDARAGVHALKEHHISGSEAGKLAPGPPRSPQDNGLRVREEGPGQDMDPVRHA